MTYINGDTPNVMQIPPHDEQKPFESVLIVDHMVNWILRATFARAYSQAVDRKLMTYSTKASMGFLKEIVHLSFIPEDKGESPGKAHSWERSEEPVSQIEDICARGILSVKEEHTAFAPLGEVAKEPLSSKKKTNSRVGDARRSAALKSSRKVDDKKTVVYKIQDPIIKNELEHTIEEIRRRIRLEEMKKQEEQKHEALGRKKRQELNDRKRIMAEVNRLSYDVSGKPVEIVSVPSLASLIAKCSSLQTETPASEFAQKKIASIKKMRKVGAMSKEEPEDIAMLRAETKKMALKSFTERESVVQPLRSLHESIIPQAGVTFYEKGKTVKESQLTLKEKLGKVARSEFQSYTSESSMKTTMSIPFFPTNPMHAKGETRGDEMTLSLPQLSLKKRRIHEQYAKKIDVTGDLAQLWEEGRKTNYFNIRKETSIRPKIYLPPTKRDSTIKSMKTQEKEHNSLRNDTDLLNLNAFDYGSTFREHNVLKRANRNTDRDFNKTLGTMRKNMRNKAIMGLKRQLVKLAPPPLGKTTGHGIIKQHGL